MGVEIITNDFADRLIALKNKITYLYRSRASSRFELKLSEWFANNLGTLRYDDNQVTEACNEIETIVDLRSTKVVNMLGKVEAHMANVPRNAQLSKSKIRP